MLFSFIGMNYQCVRKVTQEDIGRKKEERNKESRILYKEARSIASTTGCICSYDGTDAEYMQNFNGKF
jgi:hypothetical protein